MWAGFLYPLCNGNQGVFGMKCLVTGGTGFIGSHLVDCLLKEGHGVIAYDNLSIGKEEFIRHHYKNTKFSFFKADVLDSALLRSAMRGCDIVFHLSAISDIRRGVEETRLDLEQGTMATFNVLQAMKENRVSKIVFSSSNVVYGEAKVMPTPEDYGPLLPISLYAASKLACEGLITAFCHNFGIQCWIYRFGNIVGGRATHGILYDFYHKLRKNPRELEILGDGKQSKPYLEIGDCVSALVSGLNFSNEEVNLFNLGTDGASSVMTIADIVLQGMGLKGVVLKFTGGARGWPGDIPTVRLDTKKIRSLGWKSKYSSDEANRVAFSRMLKDFNYVR